MEHTLQVEYVSIDRLRPWVKNPRRNDESIASLVKSIQTFGYTNPILVRRANGEIIAGHARLKALMQLGVKTVPAIYLDLSETDAHTYALFDNKSVENVPWDENLLSDVLLELDQLNVNLDLTGFPRFEIEELMHHVDEKGKFRAGEGNLKPSGDGKFLLEDDEKANFARYKNFILDFSGGRDSTLALAWAVEHFADRKIYPVFVDPGVEFPGMSAHVAEVCEHFGVEPVILKSKLDWWAWLRKEGQWPSLLYRPCQTKFIFAETSAFRKQFSKEDTLLLDGSRASQAVRGSKKTKTSEVSSCPGYAAYHPCFDLTDEQAAELLAQSKAPLWEGYSRGFVRTACWCCPGQCGLQALALQENYPGRADDIRRWERRIGAIQPLDEGGPRYFDGQVEAGRKQEERATAGS